MARSAELDDGIAGADHDVGEPCLFLGPQRVIEREQKEKPERAREVTKNSGEQMGPADAAKPAGQHHEAVLQIALAPAAIAAGVLDHVLRRFLVAALEIV